MSDIRSNQGRVFVVTEQTHTHTLSFLDSNCSSTRETLAAISIEWVWKLETDVENHNRTQRSSNVYMWRRGRTLGEDNDQRLVSSNQVPQFKYSVRACVSKEVNKIKKCKNVLFFNDVVKLENVSFTHHLLLSTDTFIIICHISVVHSNIPPSFLPSFVSSSSIPLRVSPLLSSLL